MPGDEGRGRGSALGSQGPGKITKAGTEEVPIAGGVGRIAQITALGEQGMRHLDNVRDKACVAKAAGFWVV